MYEMTYTNKIPDLTERYPEGMRDISDRYDESLDWDLMERAEEMNKLNDMPTRFKVILYGNKRNEDHEEFFDNQYDARICAEKWANSHGLTVDDKDLPWVCYPTVWKERYDGEWQELEW